MIVIMLLFPLPTSTSSFRGQAVSTQVVGTLDPERGTDMFICCDKPHSCALHELHNSHLKAQRTFSAPANGVRVVEPHVDGELQPDQVDEVDGRVIGNHLLVLEQGSRPATAP